jgi:hypothetical protein
LQAAFPEEMRRRSDLHRFVEPLEFGGCPNPAVPPSFLMLELAPEKLDRVEVAVLLR